MAAGQRTPPDRRGAGCKGGAGSRCREEPGAVRSEAEAGRRAPLRTLPRPGAGAGALQLPPNPGARTASPKQQLLGAPESQGPSDLSSERRGQGCCAPPGPQLRPRSPKFPETRARTGEGAGPAEWLSCRISRTRTAGRGAHSTCCCRRLGRCAHGSCSPGVPSLAAPHPRLQRRARPPRGRGLGKVGGGALRGRCARRKLRPAAPGDRAGCAGAGGPGTF